jgi:two-component system sensor histidine kinase DesK
MRVRLLPDSHLGWTPYAWLIYLSFFVAYAIAGAETALDWTIHGGTVIAFLVLYFRAFWQRGLRLIAYAFGIVALGVLTIPINPGANAFFIYGAAFLGDAARPAVAFRWLLLIVVILGLESWLLTLHPYAWIPGIAFSLLIGATNIHFGEVRRKDQALRAAREAAQHMAAVAERERIARDLHDLLGHTLSVIVIKSELAAKLADRDPARAAAEIRDVEAISRNALQEVRRAIHGYRGESVEQELATGRSALGAAGVTLSADVGRLDLEPETERALALAVREAITNIIRHARARTCTVTAGVRDGSVALTIQDDGIGGEGREGSGLSGMRARIAEVGGSLDRDGARGTRLVITVPARRAVSTPDVVLR